MPDSCDVGQSLITIHDAIERLNGHACQVLEQVVVSTDKALGCVLADDVRSAINVPPSDNSAMDGYAIYVDEHTPFPCVMRVSQRIPAGETGDELSAGTAARIFTGAAIPAGANAVVMQEDCLQQGDQVTISCSVTVGQNIRYCGEDIVAGDIILKKGHACQPQSLGLAASIGCDRLTVNRRVQVAILTTGHELCEPGTALKTGQIYNSNRYTLIGLLEQMGCDCIDLGRVDDTLAATRDALLKAEACADLIISCGGVSVGEEDHVRHALASIGQLDMWRLKMKPGKPSAFGQVASTPFFGLPGNPVSVFATFHLFVQSYIQIMQGRPVKPMVRYRVASGFVWPKPDSRDEFVRVQYNDHSDGAHEMGQLYVYPNQSSGVLTSTVWATGFAFIPANSTVEVGQMLEYIPFSERSES